MKRQYNSSFAQRKMTSYAPTYTRRPFKRVRSDGTGLVPYGKSQLYTQKSHGAMYIVKGVDTEISDVSNIQTDMATSANIEPINLIASGTGSWNRIGRQVNMKSVRCRLSIKLTMEQTTTENRSRHFRYLLIYDRQPNGTIPIKSEIIQVKNSNGAEIGNWNGFLSYDNMQRFIILKDETVTLEPADRPFSATAYTSRSSTEKHLDFFLKLNLPTNYKAESTPAAMSDISTGALYIMYLTEAPSSSTSDGRLDVTGWARLRYTDK